MEKIKLKFSEPEIEFIGINSNEKVILTNSRDQWTGYYRRRPKDDFSLDLDLD